jgi:flagellar hook-basal body complex protein FliE
MELLPIQMDIARLAQPGSRTSTAGPDDTSEAVQSFGETLGKAVNSVNQAQLGADSAITRLAAGEPVDLHQVMIAMEKADIATQLATEVRNKLIEAYQEIMRMQV